MTDHPDNYEQVRQVLLLLNSGLRPFVEQEMSRVKGEGWVDSIESRDYSGRRSKKHWDTQVLLSVMWESWNEVFASTLGRAERSFVAELRDTRNKWAHQEALSDDDTYRALDTSERLLRAISSPHAVDIAERKQRFLKARFLEPESNYVSRSESVNTQHNVAESSPLKDFSNTLHARYQVRQRFGHTKHGAGFGTDTLNTQQAAAVLHRDSHLLILAGAGTGKTKTLIHRTANLLKTTPAANIVVMSFTIKAAQELYERLCRITGTSEISQLWIGTFHSVCRRMLSEHPGLLGYKSRFGVLDAEDSRDVLRRCLPHGGFLDVSRVSQMYSLSRNARVPWQGLLGKFGLTGKERFVEDVLRRYHLRMRRANRMDFDDLLTNTILLLERQPQIRTGYQQRFRYILIDEYQDTSKAQSQILELLANGGNITVVGDDSQAIYGFRGATVENILQFDNRFSSATTLKLEQNYRCTPEILDIANQSIAINKKRMLKNLFTASFSGRKPTVVEARDRAAEAEFVTDEILALYRTDLKLRDIAVLFRSAFCVRVVEDTLRSRGVPFTLFGATPFFSQPHIKDLLAWFALVSNPEDAFSLGRVWRQQRGLTEALLGRVEAEADNNDRPLLQTAFDFAGGAIPDTRTALEELQLKLSICRDEFQKTKDLTLLLDTTMNFHFNDYLRRSFTDADARLEDLSVVREMLSSYSNLETFLDEVGTEKLDVAHRIPTTAYDEGDCLSLASIHSAKGLEWRAVFLVGIVDGWIPDKRCLDEAGVEEERRLFHVAVTRAKEALYITAPRNVPDQHGDCSVPLSRFVAELPNMLFERIAFPVQKTVPSSTPTES